MNTQPYNSMIPEHVIGRYGAHHGMTMAEAEAVINRPYDPSSWQDLVDVSSAAYIVGQDAMALELAEAAARIAPVTAAFINLAVIHGSRGRFVDATLAANRAYNADPEDRTAATIYAECLLRLGRWGDGWPLFHNYYDMRRVSMFSHVIHPWQGEDLKGKRLLLIEGGGFGDNFFFLRWAKELKLRKCHITYLCPETMCGLMGYQWYIDRTIATRKGESTGELRPSEFDYYVPLLALGELLDKRVATMGGESYIGSVGSDELNYDRPPRVGFCWQAGEAGLPRPFRSLEHSQQRQITSLLKSKGHTVESLVPQDWDKNLDWTVTMRLIAKCDLIVTVDTAVAHLAGAMGKPTWVILPGYSAWYYGLGRQQPPYKSMRLFRNHVRGLDLAVTQCCKALETWKR